MPSNDQPAALIALADELSGPGHWTREEAEYAERLIRNAAADIERLRERLSRPGEYDLFDPETETT